MTRPIRTLALVTRTILKTIVETIPRIITVTRQVAEQIARSEWVTSTRQVAKTFYETVSEKVPLLGFLGRVIGFIWKTIVKPIIRWITETVRTLRTWVEKVLRWVTEKIQNGWQKLTRTLSETVREWVEKTDWVREFLERKVTVWEIDWETRTIPFPALSEGNMARILGQLGLTIGLSTLSLAMCNGPYQGTPTTTPDIQATMAACTEMSATQTVKVATITSTPTSLQI